MIRKLTGIQGIYRFRLALLLSFPLIFLQSFSFPVKAEIDCSTAAACKELWKLKEGSRCEKAEQKFLETFKDLQDACVKGDMNVKESGITGCIAQAHKCQVCFGETSDTSEYAINNCRDTVDKDAEIDEVMSRADETLGDDEPSDKKSSFSFLEELYKAYKGKNKEANEFEKQIKNEKEKREKFEKAMVSAYKTCPARGALMASDVLKEKENLKKDISTAEEDLNELEQKQLDLAQEQQTLEQNTQERMNSIKEAQDKALKEIDQNLSGRTQEIGEQVQEIASTLREIRSGYRSIQTARQDAQNKYLSAVAEAKNNCEAQALEAFSQERDDILLQIREGTYSAGGLNSMLRQTGISSKERARQIYQKYYKRCRSTDSYKTRLKTAKRTYDLALQQIANEEENLKEQEQFLRNQLQQLKSKPSMLAQEAHQNKIELIQKNAEKIKQLNEEFKKKTQLLAHKQQQLQKQIHKKQADLAILQEYKSKKEKASTLLGGREAPKQENVNKAYVLAADIQTEAKTVNTICQCEKKPSSSVACKKANEILGDDLKDKIKSIDREADR